MHDSLPVGHEPQARVSRRLPIGAEPVPGGVHCRVWAPAARRVGVLLEPEGREHPLAAEENGYFSGLVADLDAGACYRYRLDDGEPLPDPASRWQPQGPLGPSCIVDPAAYAWRDQAWRGLKREDQVLYELHVGTFTPEGTWRAAMGKLAHLAELGVTAVELMPVHQFDGRFGWGYDTVNLFAPYAAYGEPDDVRRFVDEAHRHGLGVVLDVVYNHLGPDGGFLKRFSPAYFTDRYVTDWGAAINFDQESSEPVREWVLANGRYWVEEFHVDGFRVDATQNIYDFDESHEHILAAFARHVRAAAGERGVLVIGENEPQEARLIRPPEEGGRGLDMQWNDDFHHSAIVALTGRGGAYLTDYRGTPQELVATAKRGFLYQGQRYHWQKQARGTSTKGLAPCQLVTFLQNHDQIANMNGGKRGHEMASPGLLRALTTLLLLGPGTPMLFQGQELGADRPFYYFLDNEGERAEQVDQGRRREVGQFPSQATPEVQARIPRPDDPATFAACKLDWNESGRHGELLALHRDLLRLRREDEALVAARRHAAGLDGAVLDAQAFCLRFFGPDDDDRLLVINLGSDLELTIMPEPLLAPPEGHDWTLRWSSEHPAYGGTGARPPDPNEPWVLPGRAALLLRPGPPSPRRRTALEKALAQAAAHKGEGNAG